MQKKIVKGYHDNGNIYYQCPYVNGTPRGVEEVWYETKSRIALYTYKNDEYNGIVIWMMYE